MLLKPPIYLTGLLFVKALLDIVDELLPPPTLKPLGDSAEIQLTAPTRRRHGSAPGDVPHVLSPARIVERSFPQVRPDPVCGRDVVNPNGRWWRTRDVAQLDQRWNRGAIHDERLAIAHDEVHKGSGSVRSLVKRAPGQIKQPVLQDGRGHLVPILLSRPSSLLEGLFDQLLGCLHGPHPMPRTVTGPMQVRIENIPCIESGDVQRRNGCMRR